MAAENPVIVVSGRRRLGERLGELWAYRHLVGNLVRRDLKVRYKNSVLGFFWSLFSPLLLMLVFWLVFNRFLGSPIRHYAVFILVALLPWNWFNIAMAGGMRSVVGNASLINKIYFPREILPVSVVLSEGVNFLLALPVLFAMILLAGISLTHHALWLPLIILIQAAFTIGMVLLLSTANVYYRDTAVIMDVLLVAWFFLTPIVYPMEELRGRYPFPGLDISAERLLYILNPMASLIASYRTVLYGSPQGPPGSPEILFLSRTGLTALATLAIGYLVFTHHSGRFGEEV
jgi:ABC-type polysaccharide/polyol phosphate export permease